MRRPRRLSSDKFCTNKHVLEKLLVKQPISSCESFVRLLCREKGRLFLVSASAWLRSRSDTVKEGGHPLKMYIVGGGWSIQKRVLAYQSGVCRGSVLKYGVASRTRIVWQTSQTFEGRRLGPLLTVLVRQSIQKIWPQCLQWCCS